MLLKKNKKSSMKTKISKINLLIKKRYRYELLENGFSNRDVSVGKKVLLSKAVVLLTSDKKRLQSMVSPSLVLKDFKFVIESFN